MARQYKQRDATVKRGSAAPPIGNPADRLRYYKLDSGRLASLESIQGKTLQFEGL